jgi:hypothetical protein
MSYQRPNSRHQVHGKTFLSEIAVIINGMLMIYPTIIAQYCYKSQAIKKSRIF